jgi:hypothetical protein
MTLLDQFKSNNNNSYSFIWSPGIGAFVAGCLHVLESECGGVRDDAHSSFALLETLHVWGDAQFFEVETLHVGLMPVSASVEQVVSTLRLDGLLHLLRFDLGA